MNTDADTLFRVPEHMSEYMDSCTAETCQDELRVIAQSIQLEDKGKVIWVTSRTHNYTGLHGGDPQSIASSTPQFNLSDIRQAQLKDNVIGKVYSFVNRKQRPTSSQRAAESPDTKLLLHEWPKLFIDKDGVVRRQNNSYDQVVLPRPYHPMAHLGSEHVLRLARDRFYWPWMQSDVEHYVRNICRCVKQRPPRLKTRAPLQPVITTATFELVFIDIVHLEKSSGGYDYILVIVDHFSRYAQAYPTRNKVAVTMAEKLYNDYILRFGFPAKIHHDQGGEYENKLLKTLEVRNLNERGGPGKLRSFGENDIYVVINRKDPESPVYETKLENGKGKNRVLHRNLLLPCDHLPAKNPQPPTPKPPPATLPQQHRQPLRNAAAQDEETSSDEEFSDVVMVSVYLEKRVLSNSETRYQQTRQFLITVITWLWTTILRSLNCNPLPRPKKH
ncbi:Retrovirus-related Pol poly from transposon 412 [Paramuricea clavata]|uniref:Retrovirus-related Pol poly from transposon 412, partial n=1 Tax=Paramuricea clavata TaxID=317549 RepID=A0A7D9HP27_PARCT|nr:Retrovirus-related Pol poly from transposon 412 [Paramuricea clavata]